MNPAKTEISRGVNLSGQLGSRQSRRLLDCAEEDRTGHEKGPVKASPSGSNHFSHIRHRQQTAHNGRAQRLAHTASPSHNC